MPTICAVYIRKSREEKDRPSHRLTVQREQLPAHARAQGWQVESYDDGHASAARGKTEDLKQRNRLEADIKTGRVNIILTIELSRLSRDDSLQDYVGWLHLCSQHNVKLATLSRILDPSQHSDWMLLLMEGGFSSVEMKVLQGRMKEGRVEAFRAGKWLGGTPPAPYIYRDGSLQVDQDLLRHMQTLWTLAETNSARAIAKELNMPEIAVRRAIADDRLLLYQALRTDPESDQLIRCDWQPVMDSDQAARIRSGRRTRRKTPGAKRTAVSLLSNLELVYCGFCGRTVKTWNNSKTKRDGSRVDYYGCQVKNDRHACPQSRMITQTELDERVINNIFRTMAKVDKLKQAWQISQEQGSVPTELKELDRAEQEANAQKTRLVDAVADGLLSSGDVKSKRAELETTLARISTRRQSLLSQMAAPPDWEDLLTDRADFDLLTLEEKREFITSVLTRLDVYAGHAILTYRFPRNPKGDPTSRINLDPPKRPHPKNDRQNS